MTMFLTMRYIKLFGFVCPKCGQMFFKNIYAMRENKTGVPEFYIPDEVKEKGRVTCPYKYKLDMKTGEKTIESGCGHKFMYRDRKIPRWDVSKFLAYDNKDLMDKIFTMPDFSPIIADEAVKFASSQSWSKSDSKDLKDLFTVIRPRRFLMFFNVPEMTWIDQRYREGMSSFWMRIIERGRCVLFEKDKGEAKDKYHLKELEELMGVVKFFTPMDKIKAKLKKHPCYFDTFDFPAIPEKQYAEYELYRNAVNLQRQVEERELSNKDIAKIAVYNIMRNWDRLKIEIDKSKEYRPTYALIADEITSNPLTRERVVSDATLRNWVDGVSNYIKTKGQNALVFDGGTGHEKEIDDQGGK